MHLRIPMSFPGLVIFHCLDGLQFIYAFTHLREGSLVLFEFCNYT
jgi:hypothetical protein